MIIQSSTGYGYVKDESDNVLQKVSCDVNTDIIVEDGTWVEVASAEELAAVSVVIYNPQDLKNWAMASVFTSDLIPHFAAFLDFANVADDDAKTLFLTYASAVGLTETANTIVAKAIELGADIEEV